MSYQSSVKTPRDVREDLPHIHVDNEIVSNVVRNIRYRRQRTLEAGTSDRALSDFSTCSSKLSNFVGLRRSRSSQSDTISRLFRANKGNGSEMLQVEIQNDAILREETMNAIVEKEYAPIESRDDVSITSADSQLTILPEHLKDILTCRALQQLNERNDERHRGTPLNLKKKAVTELMRIARWSGIVDPGIPLEVNTAGCVKDFVAARIAIAREMIKDEMGFNANKKISHTPDPFRFNTGTKKSSYIVSNDLVCGVIEDMNCNIDELEVIIFDDGNQESLDNGSIEGPKYETPFPDVASQASPEGPTFTGPKIIAVPKEKLHPIPTSERFHASKLPSHRGTVTRKLGTNGNSIVHSNHQIDQLSGSSQKISRSTYKGSQGFVPSILKVPRKCERGTSTRSSSMIGSKILRNTPPHAKGSNKPSRNSANASRYSEQDASTLGWSYDQETASVARSIVESAHPYVGSSVANHRTQSVTGHSVQWSRQLEQSNIGESMLDGPSTRSPSKINGCRRSQSNSSARIKNNRLDPVYPGDRLKRHDEDDWTEDLSSSSDVEKVTNLFEATAKDILSTNFEDIWLARGVLHVMAFAQNKEVSEVVESLGNQIDELEKTFFAPVDKHDDRSSKRWLPRRGASSNHSNSHSGGSASDDSTFLTFLTRSESS